MVRIPGTAPLGANPREPTACVRDGRLGASKWYVAHSTRPFLVSSVAVRTRAYMHMQHDVIGDPLVPCLSSPLTTPTGHARCACVQRHPWLTCLVSLLAAAVATSVIVVEATRGKGGHTDYALPLVKPPVQSAAPIGLKGTAKLRGLVDSALADTTTAFATPRLQTLTFGELVWNDLKDVPDFAKEVGKAAADAAEKGYEDLKNAIPDGPGWPDIGNPFRGLTEALVTMAWIAAIGVLLLCFVCCIYQGFRLGCCDGCCSGLRDHTGHTELSQTDGR